MKWPLGWNWDKVREWIKVGALVVIAFSMLQIAGLLRGIDYEIGQMDSSLDSIFDVLNETGAEIGQMEVSLDSIFDVLNER